MQLVPMQSVCCMFRIVSATQFDETNTDAIYIFQRVPFVCCWNLVTFGKCLKHVVQNEVQTDPAWTPLWTTTGPIWTTYGPFGLRLDHARSIWTTRGPNGPVVVQNEVQMESIWTSVWTTWSKPESKRTPFGPRFGLRFGRLYPKKHRLSLVRVNFRTQKIPRCGFRFRRLYPKTIVCHLYV